MSQTTESQPTASLALPSAPPAPPSVHARAVITWIAIFPLVTLGFFAIAPFANDWNPVLRALVLVVPQLMLDTESCALAACAERAWPARTRDTGHVNGGT